MKKLRRILLILIVIAFYCFLPARADDVKIGLIYSRKYGEKLPLGIDRQKNYRQAIEAAGGKVVALLENYDEKLLQEQLGKIDGLVIPGGRDVSPRFYNEEPDEKLESTDAAFDEFEFKVLKFCLEKKLPIMGICRGHQLINVYLGGSLIQDIPSLYHAETMVIHRVRKKGKKVSLPCYHPVNVEKESVLYQVIPRKTLRVNSFHHQAVKKLGEGLKVTARTADGIIEAMEGTGDVFIIGFQFHPERLRLEDPVFENLFKRFINEAGKVKNKRVPKEAVPQ